MWKNLGVKSKADGSLQVAFYVIKGTVLFTHSGCCPCKLLAMELFLLVFSWSGSGSPLASLVAARSWKETCSPLNLPAQIVQWATRCCWVCSLCNEDSVALQGTSGNA